MSARPLLVVGGGGLAREVLSLVSAVNTAAPAWRVRGVLDDDPARHGGQVSGVPVLGPPELAYDDPDAAVVLCTASPADRSSRYRLCRRLDLPEQRYAALVHPAAVLAPSTEVSPGAVVLAGTVATADVVIGPHAVVMPSCVLTHDDELAAFATLASGVLLGGGVRIGTGAYVGAGAAVREGRRLGQWCLIGMGSVVLHDVPASETWWGAPARRRRVDVPAGVDGGTPRPRPGRTEEDR
jgi:sugar O-acyltransferase (sialic acid O-acetyltransferase NeuD family)